MIEIKCPKCGTVQTVEGCKPIPAGQRPGATYAGMPRVVTDSAGRLVTVPCRPRRVVALNASNLGLYYATGGEVVARTATNLLSPDLKERVKSVPMVGLPPSPDVARIIALKPDLVLGMHAPMHHAVAAVLEKNNIPVLLQALEHYTDVLKTLRLYGELSGNPSQAARKIEAIEIRRKELLQKNSVQTPPRVLIIWQIADGLYSALSNSFVGDLVKRLGGVNVADLVAAIDESLQYAPLHLENIIPFQPDVVLVVSHSFEFAAGRTSAAALPEQPGWQELDAVQRGAVYQLPYHLFAVNPGPQLEEALAVLAEYLYERRVL